MLDPNVTVKDPVVSQITTHATGCCENRDFSTRSKNFANEHSYHKSYQQKQFLTGSTVDYIYRKLGYPQL